MYKFFIPVFLLFTFSLSVAEEIKPLVYRGRTFESWLESPGRELDDEYLQTTIKALRAFGIRGYGAQAATAIYEAVEDRNFQRRQVLFHDSHTFTSIERVAISALASIALSPENETMPMLEKLFNDNDRNKQALACQVFIDMGYRFPEKKLPMILERALKNTGQSNQEIWESRCPVDNLIWTNMLGSCDSSGKTVIAYLRELVKRKDVKRFVEAFSSIYALPQSIHGTGYHDWTISMNNEQNWYPRVTLGPGKGTGPTITEHGKDLLRFFEEEGMKSDDEGIRKWSEHLLLKLKEAVPQESSAPRSMPVPTQTVPLAPFQESTVR